MSKTLCGQLLRVTLLTGQLCTVTFLSAPLFSVTLVISQIRAESVSYEEYACKSRSLKRNDKQFEMSALNPIDDPYTQYKRERDHRDDEGSRVRGRNIGNRERERKYRRKNSDSRDYYRKPRRDDSQEYRDSADVSRSRRKHLSVFDESKPLEEMEDETFERYKYLAQEKINTEYEKERKENLMKMKKKHRTYDNFVEQQMFGANKEYMNMAPNAPARKFYGQKNPRFEKQYGKHFRHKPLDKNHESMKDLVFDLYSQGLIKSSKIYDVMLKMDRQHYLMRTNDSFYPYKDQIQYLPMGVIINAPHEHARALELLRDQLKPGAKVLDIGSGGGYLTACFAELVGPEGQVTAVELIPEVLQFTQYNVEQGNPELLSRIKFELSDGRASFGQNGPYDVIHVGGAYSRHPDIFLLHLKCGGRLLIPIGETRQQLLNIYDKFVNGTVEKQSWGLVQFPYLKSTSQQLRIMEVPKPKPMSVALKHYIEKMMNDRLADMSDPIQTTESIKRLRAGDKKGGGRRLKKKKFYNLGYEQKKHKMDEAEG